MKIDSGSWEDAKFDGIEHWIYDWDTTMVDDGIHIINARCRDDKNNSFNADPISVKVDNADPIVEWIFPTEGYLHLVGAVFPTIHLWLIIGILPICTRMEKVRLVLVSTSGSIPKTGKRFS